MKTNTLFLLLALLLTATIAQARPDEKSKAAANERQKVQASPDNPNRRKQGAVTGTVVDEAGKPVGAATVELMDPVTEEPGQSVKTDEKGKYKFSDLLPGEHKLQARKGGKQSDSVTIKVENGPSNGPNLVLKDKKM